MILSWQTTPHFSGQSRLSLNPPKGHPPQYVAQSQEISVSSAPLAVKPGAFSSFTSPYPGRKVISVETHHPAGSGGGHQGHLYPADRYGPEQQQQYNRYHDHVPLVDTDDSSLPSRP